tara:strand:+ start:143892 stop:144107 length:216 start_codon:yes stop_codon:yes gene_type:complete
MKAKEVRELSVDEMQKTLREKREELLNLRLKKTTGQVENPDQIRKLRRLIARLETISLEKTKGEQTASQAA